MNKKISDFSKRNSHVSPKEVSLLRGNFSFLKRKSLNKKGTIAIFELTLVLLSIFAFAFLISDKTMIVSAASSSSSSNPSYCCEQTKQGGTCLNAPESNCSTSNGMLAAPTSCEYTSYCQSGTCYNSGDGMCMQNTPKTTCEKYTGATWDSRPINQVPQCQLGCCIIADQAAFVTLTRCKSLSTQFGAENVFRTDITTESDCIATANAQDMGACVYEQDYQRQCEFTTRADCGAAASSEFDASGNVSTPQGRTFYKDFLCSNDDLGTVCAAAKSTTCYNGDVYWVDSCGNRENIFAGTTAQQKALSQNNGKIKKSVDTPEDWLGNCNYLGDSKAHGASTRCAKKSGFVTGTVLHECKSTSCDVPESIAAGKTLRNGESVCISPDGKGDNTFKPDTSGAPSLVNGGEKVGSRYFRGICRDGKLVVEPCADYRNEICVQGKVAVEGQKDFSTSMCRVNRWQDCATQTYEKDCNNTAKRDCKWFPSFTGLLLASPDADGKPTQDGICVPAYAPGTNFWEQGSTDEICKLGSSSCNKTTTDRWHLDVQGAIAGGDLSVNKGDAIHGQADCGDATWAQKANQVCVAMGDCGGYVNYAEGNGAGYQYTASKYNDDTKKWEVTTESGLKDSGSKVDIGSSWPLSKLFLSLTAKVIAPMTGRVGADTTTYDNQNLEKIKAGEVQNKFFTSAESFKEGTVYTINDATHVTRDVDGMVFKKDGDIWLYSLNGNPYKTLKKDINTDFYAKANIAVAKVAEKKAEEDIAPTSTACDCYVFRGECVTDKGFTEKKGDSIDYEYDDPSNLVQGIDTASIPWVACENFPSLEDPSNSNSGLFGIFDSNPLSFNSLLNSLITAGISTDPKKESGPVECKICETKQASEECKTCCTNHKDSVICKDTAADKKAADACKKDKTSEICIAYCKIHGDMEMCKGVKGAKTKNTFDALGFVEKAGVAATWATGAYLIGKTVAQAGLFSLNDETQSNSFASAVAGATFIGSLLLQYKAGWWAAGGALVAGGLIMLITYADETTESYDFECMPWQAPTGGKNCEVCNNDDIPCSEYRCRSLGQNCEIVNKGTDEEKCVNVDPNDATPPVIYPDTEHSSNNLKFDKVVSNPPNPGFTVVYTGTKPGCDKDSSCNPDCIPAFTPITIGISTRDPNVASSDPSADGRGEPAQCKIDYKHTDSFDKMMSFMGNSNYFEYSHSQTFSLPSVEDLNNSGFELKNGNEMSFFIRCQDKSGNVDDAEFEARFCIDPTPDTTAPVIKTTSVADGSCVGEGQLSTDDVIFYTNEPATCKWSDDDKAFQAMENTMTPERPNAGSLFANKATLTGITLDGKNFFVRCGDRYGNNMSESKKFTLRGSTALTMKNLQPNGTETIFGAVDPTPVELRTETSLGCDNGKATCYYAVGKDNYNADGNGYVQFFDTNKADGVHTQKLNLGSGEHEVFVRCIDAGGNVVQGNTTFNVDIDPNAPIVARVYEESGMLKLVTVRDSQCRYTLDSCDFEFLEGTEMPYPNSTTHVAEWNNDKTYYIKCQDKYIGAGADCSIIVKPTEKI